MTVISSKQIQTYTTAMTSFLQSLQPSDASTPHTTPSSKPFVAHTTPQQLPTGSAAARDHALMDHSTTILQAAGDVLALYTKTARQIEALQVPPSPRPAITQDRTKLAEVLVCGSRVAEAQLATVLGPRPKELGEGAEERNGGRDADAQRWRAFMSKFPGDGEKVKMLVSEEGSSIGGGVAEIVKDVKKGVRRMVKKLPFEVDSSSD